MSKIKLFLDAGHGGRDPGAVGNGMHEADINFDVCIRLADILRPNGFDIMLSRPTIDVTPRHPRDGGQTINARAIMSNEWGADYFISIHVNAAGGTGAESFFWGANARKFSQTILDKYCKLMGLRNRRNEMTDRWGVIRMTNCPAILFELAFIDAPPQKPDINILRNKRQEMAEAMAQGIFKYFNITLRQESGSPIGGDTAFPMDIQKAINILHRHGVINSPDYWRHNYHRLAYVDRLIINMAAKLEGRPCPYNI